MAAPSPFLQLVHQLVRSPEKSNADLHCKLHESLQRLKTEVAAVERAGAAADWFQLDALIAALADTLDIADDASKAASAREQAAP
jgi:hypothetical protein